MKISIIVAVSKNNVIGNQGKLIWHISEDLKHFKKITTGHCILMGKNTYESIGRPLSLRTNLILSSNKEFKVDGAFVFNNPQDAVKFAKKKGEKELMIIGGEKDYRYFLPKADKIYLTKVLKNYNGNATFPEIKNEDWARVNYEAHHDLNPPFEYINLERI